MTDTIELPASFRHVRLLLARGKDHPAGSAREGYDVLVPLDPNGRLDPHAWRAHQALCSVRRFRENGSEKIGRLRRKPGGQWCFNYEQGRSDDEIGFRLTDERFLPGKYVSIVTAGMLQTYRVAHVEKP